MKDFVLAVSFSCLFLCCTAPATDENADVEIVVDDSPFAETEKEEQIGQFEQSLIDQGLVDIQAVDPSLMVELKYSTEDNFFGTDVYEELTRAYLPKDVAEKLKVANQKLQDKYPEYRLYVFDAVRPHRIQKILWHALDSIPVGLRSSFVADPSRGSLHNYGCAIDLSVFDTAADSLLDMGTKYDYFGNLAYPSKEKLMQEQGLLSAKAIENRIILRNAMHEAGFNPITSEWWHFNSTSLAHAKERYPLVN
ncbi:M15 family metallopeptidase [Marinilongibacter aquaticus]|uniref:M15 family metallopeptidase n=1 Tax=Marinilongibacter aquaticus TaxID=2975157 RepID=UPI0021BD8B9F|nr:M15 family metallopeptidase [Marinilongibacter aquaticus]UBM60518.1 M15 family metallopeptidase [Marinilongibacter aquaticus]